MSIKSLYKDKKSEIDDILGRFSLVLETYTPEEVLTEMLFCICTPQTDAHKGWQAALNIRERNLIKNSRFSPDYASALKDAGVRFHKTKAKSALKMVNDFSPPETIIKIRSLIDETDVIKTRNHLAKIIKGWGLKEASHFLRNVGYGHHVAILDRHILRRLIDHNIISEIPETLDKKSYLDIEQKMLQFSKEIDIPMEALDLLFWYQSKGEFFK